MAQSSSFSRRWRARFVAYRWRRVGLLAGSSLALSLSLIGYLFGLSDGFAGRVLMAFFVWFCLLSLTFLALIPFVGWATVHWFGRGWQASAADRPARSAVAPTRASAPKSRSTST